MQPDNWGDGMNTIQGPSSDDMIGLYKTTLQASKDVLRPYPTPPQENGLYVDLGALLGQWRGYRDLSEGKAREIWGWAVLDLQKVLDKHK